MVYLGRWDEAIALWEDHRAEEDLPEGLLNGPIMLTPVYVHRGDLDTARKTLALLPEGENTRDVQGRVVYQVARAPVLRAEGRLAEALAAGLDAWGAGRVIGLLHQSVKEGLAEALEAAFALNDLAKVEELLGEIEALRPGELSPYGQAQGARFGARLAAARGDRERVELGYAAAAGRFRALSMPFLLAVTLLEHAEWLVGQGSIAEAGPLLSEARDTFEQLKASPWLERITAALPSGQRVGA